MPFGHEPRRARTLSVIPAARLVPVDSNDSQEEERSIWQLEVWITSLYGLRT